MDLKNGVGGTRPGTVEKPDVTMTVATAELLDICAGKADAQKLFFAGKLKLAGNMLVAQKLDFLRSIDRKLFDDALAESGGGSATSPATTASSPSATKSSASTTSARPMFDALAARLAKSPGLATEFGAVYQFVVGDDRIVVDLTKGEIRDGLDANAAVALRISAEDLAELAAGRATERDLHQRGKLRVDGDVRLAHRLSFLSGLA